VIKFAAAGLWFSPGTPVSSTNKTDCHDITEILLKVALSTITIIITTQFLKPTHYKVCGRSVVLVLRFPPPIKLIATI
jgi:hypothetical protein